MIPPKVSVKDKAKYPKVQDVYENQFKDSYRNMIKASINEVEKKMK